MYFLSFIEIIGFGQIHQKSELITCLPNYTHTVFDLGGKERGNQKGTDLRAAITSILMFLMT